MKIISAKVAAVSTAFIIGSLSISYAATAATNTAPSHPMQVQAAPVASFSPYTLSIANWTESWLSPQDPFPGVSVAIQNTSKHQSLFYLSNPMTDYQWDVSCRPSNDPKTPWQPVAPFVKLEPPRGLLEPFQEKFWNVSVPLDPGQKSFAQLLTLTNYGMKADGDYRISLWMQLPDCTARDAESGPAGEKITECTLVTVRSNTIILRHTATGFADVTSESKNATK